MIYSQETLAAMSKPANTRWLQFDFDSTAVYDQRCRSWGLGGGFWPPENM